MNYVLYNPLSGAGNSEAAAVAQISQLSGDSTLINMTELSGYGELLEKLTEADTVTVVGGDGTLNRFVNGLGDAALPCDVYYLPAGSGNDFAKDVKPDLDGKPFKINEYIKDLPTVTVGGKKMRFINGVGYGIDGYCCAVGDKERERGNKSINYTAIAIKGLLFGYKPTDMTVTVDGKEYSFKKCWIVPTMLGRHYGGGMMPTPDQKRGEGELSVMVFHGTGKLRTLMIFPSIFKGEHVAHKKAVTVFTGKSITVKSSRPTFLQVDGETMYDVSEYAASI